MPEVASNVELQSDDTFAMCQDKTLKHNERNNADLNEDFLSVADDNDVEQGRHSQKLQDSLAHSESSVSGRPSQGNNRLDEDQTLRD